MDWLFYTLLALLAGALFGLYRRERAARRQLAAAQARNRREITRRDDRLAHSQAFQTAHLALSADAVIYLDAGRRVQTANPAARALFGDPPAGTSLTAWLPHHQLAEIVSQTLDNRLEITHQFDYQNRVFKVRAAPVQTDGQLLGAVLILQDVSELQRLGRARRDFVANISHDLRTPIAGIRLMAETLLGGALKDRRMARHLAQKIVDEADTLQQINDELMDLSMIESGRMPLVLVSLNLTKRVKKEVKRLKEFAKRKNVRLVVDMPPKVRVLADKGMLSRVITNLLHNAIKFTDEGEVTVRVARHAEDDMVCLMVADTGVGIAPEDQPRIFERFFKSDDRARSRHTAGAEPKRTGTGLGLAIVRHIVEAHGGKVWVESTPGKGSTFYLTLPPDEGEGDD